jgi:post-segregation antitoxin (ccd killing protein)
MRIYDMKRKGERTVPMNISVPASLKKRMEKHSEINWSATASRAFQRQLQVQEELDKLSEPEVSGSEALARALRVQHSHKVVKMA